jgi:hypothetical protein
MAQAPWRCSECGTINEPVANACRTCGRWPSLFDLEANVVEEAAPEPVETEEVRRASVEVEEPPTFETGTFEPEAFEPRTLDTRSAHPESFDAELDADVEPDPDAEERSRGKRLVSFLVPIAFVVYLAISMIFGER